ncbi:hypothetical protein ACIRBX_24930 [Kitasatospora sp. NPDC096147]|uniref:hypothetical protein n=1 Tax=Kitasatospora sp. NPDC096147 TaxID=3364093 RepID=UPI0037F1467F
MTSRFPAPMQWAFLVQESDVRDEPPTAEAIVETDVPAHRLLLQDAADSGFTMAAAAPPATTARLVIEDRTLARLLLSGGHRVWEPVPPPELSPRWLDTARTRNEAVVVVVPPGTWPTDMDHLAPADQELAFLTRLQQTYASGLVLHGRATI